jgi:hypothetical protein
VLLYQTTRSYIHCLVNDIFRPFIIVSIQSAGATSAQRSIREVALIVGAQSCVTVYSIFSEVADIYLFLKQIDFSILTTLALIIADGQMTGILCLFSGPAALAAGEYGLLSQAKI